VLVAMAAAAAAAHPAAGCPLRLGTLLARALVLPAAAACYAVLQPAYPPTPGACKQKHSAVHS
jgi:hypothetical protein